VTPADDETSPASETSPANETSPAEEPKNETYRDEVKGEL